MTGSATGFLQTVDYYELPREFPSELDEMVCYTSIGPSTKQKLT